MTLSSSPSRQRRWAVTVGEPDSSNQAHWQRLIQCPCSEKSELDSDSDSVDTESSLGVAAAAAASARPGLRTRPVGPAGCRPRAPGPGLGPRRRTQAGSPPAVAETMMPRSRPAGPAAATAAACSSGPGLFRCSWPGRPAWASTSSSQPQPRRPAGRAPAWQCRRVPAASMWSRPRRRPAFYQSRSAPRHLS